MQSKNVRIVISLTVAFFILLITGLIASKNLSLNFDRNYDCIKHHNSGLDVCIQNEKLAFTSKKDFIEYLNLIQLSDEIIPVEIKLRASTNRVIINKIFINIRSDQQRFFRINLTPDTQVDSSLADISSNYTIDDKNLNIDVHYNESLKDVYDENRLDFLVQKQIGYVLYSLSNSWPNSVYSDIDTFLENNKLLPSLSVK